MTDNTVVIRSFNPSAEELEQCRDVIRSVWIDHGHPKEIADQFIVYHGTNNIEEDYLQRPRSHWWVAVVDGNKVVGTVALLPLSIADKSCYDEQIAQPYFPDIHPDSICELKHMSVSSQYQKQKIGYKLLQTLLEFARENQYKAVHLASALDWKPASRFYERCGFERGKIVCFSTGREKKEANFEKMDSMIFKSINDLSADDWKEIDRPISETRITYVQHYWMKL